MKQHRDRYRGVRWVTVTCRCGWISMNHRSRGEARRAWEGHTYRTRGSFRVGVNAHRVDR